MAANHIQSLRHEYRYIAGKTEGGPGWHGEKLIASKTGKDYFCGEVLNRDPGKKQKNGRYG
jgi:hypothetical protein